MPKKLNKDSEQGYSHEGNSVYNKKVLGFVGSNPTNEMEYFK